MATSDDNREDTDVITTIGIKNLRMDCIIGIRERERDALQPVVVDVELEGDFTDAAASGRLEDTVDYGRVIGLLNQLVEHRRFGLLESLATEAGELLLERFPAVRAVRLELRKPSANAAADYAYVVFEGRRRPETA